MLHPLLIFSLLSQINFVFHFGLSYYNLLTYILKQKEIKEKHIEQHDLHIN